MIDAVFTYGGECLGVIAIGFWAWLAVKAFPTLSEIAARYEDDMQFGARYASRQATRGKAWVGQAALGLTAISIVCQSIGFAIPD